MFKENNLSQKCRILSMGPISQNFAGQKTFIRNLPIFHHRPFVVSFVFWFKIYIHHHTNKLDRFELIKDYMLMLAN